MSEGRRRRAAALPGDPVEWPATLRELLRAARTDPPSRAALEARLTDDDETEPTEAVDANDGDDADAETTGGRRLAFLEAVGVLECADGECAPGPHGREFLDTHDEAVLFEGLVSGVAGFEPVLEALAVRPVTDVEIADLLSAEFDADREPADVAAHREWLTALGYVDHDDGVNDLTRRGRLLVETHEALSPPTPPGGGLASGGDPEADAGGSDPGAVGQSAVAGRRGPGAADRGRPTDPTVGTDPAGGSSPATGPGVSGDADEGAGAGASGTETTEAAPDGEADEDSGGAADAGESAAAFAEELRRRYDHTCAVCGDRRQRAPGEGYARLYHPMPRSEPHGGPATAENAVVVCPNHRADFAHGLLRVDPQTLEIEHAYEAAVSGRTLATAEDHRVGAQYLAYHNDVVADF